MSDVRKQAIDSVDLNVIAELPAVQEFIDDPAHRSYINSYAMGAQAGVTIGTIKGTEVMDIDPERDGFRKTVAWLFDPTSTWKLDAPETKWYALRDAAGSLHVTAAEDYGDELDIPAGYATKELRPVFDENYNITGYEMQEAWHEVWVVFQKDENGSWIPDLFAFAQENGSYRLIPASEFQGDYELWPTMEVPPYGKLIPISKKPFMLTSETAGNLTAEYMDINEIGEDVGDNDGDGKASHNTVAVTNIYGHQTDITDKVDHAAKIRNTLAAKGKTFRIKYSKVKKKAQSVKRSKVIRITDRGQGTLSYKLVSAKKGKKSFRKYFRINGKTGKVTVKKGLKKGTYKVKAGVRAAGNDSYDAAAWKIVTFKVKVK